MPEVTNNQLIALPVALWVSGGCSVLTGAKGVWYMSQWVVLGKYLVLFTCVCYMKFVMVMCNVKYNV